MARHRLREFLRFCLVGGGAALLSTSCLWALTDGLGLHYLASYCLTFLAVNAGAFVATRRFTFRGQQARGGWRGLLRYYALSASSLGVNALLLWLLVSVAGLWYLAAALMLAALNAPVNYLLHRRFTFGLGARKPAPSSPASTPLRVLQVSAFFAAHGGGIEVVAGELAQRLARSGSQVTWMAGGGPTECPTVAVPGLRIEHASGIDLLERRLGLPAPIWSPHALRQLWRHMRDCDVVQVHDYLYFGSLAALIFARCQNRPVVLTQHIGDIPFESALPRRILRTLNRTLGAWCLGGADQVVFVGRPVLEYFEPRVHWRQPPRLIANGVDHARYRPTERQAPESQRLELLFVGRFVEKKGLRLLARCADLAGLSWTFLGRGPLSPADWVPAPEQLHLRGVAAPDEVAEAMRAADLLVLPSKGEGFPLVVQEALACGTPVLVSQDVARAFPRLDPDCVWSVDVASADAQAAQRLREQIELLRTQLPRVRAARAAAAALASQWSWERCVEDYLALYVQLARKPRAPDADLGGRRARHPNEMDHDDG